MQYYKMHSNTQYRYIKYMSKQFYFYIICVVINLFLRLQIRKLNSSLMETKFSPQTIKHNLQDSMSKHKKNYQKYLNNIYQTIKQKQFYIHRSQTPNVQYVNHADISKLSGRSQKISNKEEGLKSLPKLALKDTISNQVLQIALSSGQNKKIAVVSQVHNNSNSPKKPNSSHKKHHNNNKNSPSLNKIYQFGNFPQPKPSIASYLYGNPTLRESKQMAKNSSLIKQKNNQQTKQKTLPLSERHKNKRLQSVNQNNQYKTSVYRKISKDNMNLLGLNVQKMAYSQKREALTNNKRFMYIRVTKPQDQQQEQELYKNQNMLDQNLFQADNQENGVLIQDMAKKNINDQIDIDFCQQLISQKMQFSKRNIFQGQQRRVPTGYSPNKAKRIVSTSGKNTKQIQNNENQQLNPIYQTRYKKYLDLILRLTFSYSKYGQMDPEIHANMHTPIRIDKKYKAWIGTGNNGNLLIALIKRRFWWHIVEQKSWNVNFLWTQLKNNQYFKVQSDKLKAKSNPNYKSTKLNYIQNAETKMDQSTSLSVDHQNSSQKKITLLHKSRAQSSLPGSLNDKRKQITNSPKKRMVPQMSQQQNKNLQRVLNKNQIVQFKKVSKKIQNKLFSDKLDIMQIEKFNSIECRMHNHLTNNFYLGNKKALFHNLKEYYSLIGGDLFKTVPLTFHIKKGVKDPQYKRFLAYYKKRQSYIKKQEKQMDAGLQQKRKMRNIWIVKPGQLTNRGNGITVIDQIYELNSIFKSQGTHNDGSQKTFIVQLYIDRPLLYKKRKFDIRHYMLITHLHGVMKGYWFEEGYIRTSGYQFDVQEFQREIHLTNDAVQKYTPNYGRFEPANKISYAQFQKYLDTTYPKKNYSFYDQILPRMKQICLDSIKSAFLKLSPQKIQHNFQLFGMDFMIDSDFKPWLIQINTNPCLQLTNALQCRLLPQVVDEALRLTLDVIYPPPCHYPNTYRHLVPETSNMKSQLIFDERVDGQQIKKLYEKRKINEKTLLQQIGQLQDDQVYEDEGKEDLKLQQLLQS